LSAFALCFAWLEAWLVDEWLVAWLEWLVDV
jgi:hypothetical protein